MILIGLGLSILGLTSNQTAIQESLQPISHWNAGKYIDVAQSDDGTILALFQNGLEVFQHQADGSVIPLGQVSLGYQTPTHLLAFQETAAILTGNGLTIVEFKNPSRPTIASRLQMQGSALAADGSTILVLGNTIRAVDISDIYHPQITHQYQLGFNPLAGFRIDHFLITLEKEAGLRAFTIDADTQTLTPIGQTTGPQTGPIVDAFQTERYIFVAGEGIFGFEIGQDGALEPHTSLATNLDIGDLDLIGDRLIWAGAEGDFDGLEYAQLDEDFLLNSPPTRLARGPFARIRAIDAANFLGVTREGGIHLYRPETSFSLEQAIAPNTSILAVEYSEPFAFLAKPDEVEVISFETASHPLSVSKSPGISAPVQMVKQKDGWLHLAGSSEYRRFSVSPSGQLTLENVLEIPKGQFTDNILDMQVLENAVWIVKDAQLFRLRLVDDGAPEVLDPIDFPNTSFDQMILHAPYVTTNFLFGVNTYELNRSDQLEPVTEFVLDKFDGRGSTPLSLQNHLLLAGGQTFDYRQVGYPREIHRGPYLFSRTVLEDDFLYGINDTGIQIWDFENPESPVFLREQTAIPGTHLLSGTGNLLSFQPQPSVLTLLSKPRLSSGAILPWLVDNAEFKSQVGFFNGSEVPASLQLTATNRFGVTTERALQLSPNSSQTYDASQLFPNLNGYALSIDAPRTVAITYININIEPQSGGDSPSQTTALRLDDLSDQIAFNITGPPATAAITLVTPDDGETIPVNLRLSGDQGFVAEKTISLETKRPMPLQVNELFTEPIGEGGVIVATSEGGQRLAGTAFTFNQNRQPAMSQPFSPSDGTNTLGLTRQSSYGDAQAYDSFLMKDGLLIQAGADGVVIRETLRPGQTRLTFKPEHRAIDAASYSNYLYVLTTRDLEIRNMNTGALLHSVHHGKVLDRLKISDGMLLLIGKDLGTVIPFDLTAPLNPVALPAIAIGIQPRDAIFLNGQIFITVPGVLLVYQQTADGSFDHLGQLQNHRSLSQLFLYKGVIWAPYDNGIQEYSPVEGQLPTENNLYIGGGRLIAIDGDRGLTFYSRNQIGLFDLKDRSRLGTWLTPSGYNIAQGALWRDYVWVRDSLTSHLKLLSFSNPEQPRTLTDVTTQTIIEAVTKTSSALYFTDFGGWSDGSLNILEDGSPPSALKSFPLGFHQPSSIQVQDGWAYVADAGGLSIVNLQEPEPTIAAELGQHITTIALNQRYLVTASNAKISEIYDILDPANPILLASYTNESIANGVVFDNNLLLNSESGFGLRIFNVISPQQPQLIGEVRIGPGANASGESIWDLAYRGRHAYLATSEGLVVVDYQNPSNPRIVERLAFEKRLRKVVVKDHFLFAGGVGHLTILDISERGQPREIGSYHGDFSVSSLYVEDRHIWIADGNHVQQFEWQAQATTLPWTVQTHEFQTQIQLTNLAGEANEVALNAIDTQGRTHLQTVVLPPNSAKTLSPVDLFPDLGSSAISVDTNSSQFTASFNTFSLNQDGQLGAPAQASGIPSQNLQDGLVFTFPNAIHTAAIVIVAPFNQGEKTVRLDLFGPLAGWPRQRSRSRIAGRWAWP